ncbi:MAG TPA: PH domain-containing protein [Bryobacteraceae bacterium]|nr:PH domain-containing protein [Bryobacteraceae bacterium]
MVVRPSTKLLMLSYALAAGGALAIAVYNSRRDEPVNWLYVLPALIFVWTALRHFARRFRVMTVGDGRLRYESGLISRSVRTLELSRVQDVSVDQSFGQRLLGIGDLSIETAGERGGFVMHAIDRPRQIADYILDSARHDTGEQWRSRS